MKHAAVRSLILATLSLGALAPAGSACSSSSVSQVATGSADVTLSLSSALQAAPVGRVDVTVSGTGITTPITTTLAAAGSGYGGTIDAIPAGTGRTFTASLYDANGVVTFTGTVAGVTIEAGKTALVSLLLQQITPPNPFANSAPVLTGLTASALKAAPGDAISLGATATDADGDALAYRWTASNGTFDNATSASPVWTAGSASASSPQTVSVEVSDTHGATAGATLTIASIAPPAPTTGSASVTASVNTWPVVANVLASPTRLDVGDTTRLSATASDVDGDAVTYSWTSTCAGSFSTQSGAAPSFTLSSLSASKTCSFTVAAQDGRGGTGRGTLAIQTAPAVTAQTPGAALPVFGATSQSVMTTSANGAVDFTASAQAADGTPITLTWTASAGHLWPPFNFGTTGWYAPIPFLSPATVTATARDAAGGVTTKDFVVTPKPYVPISYCGAVFNTVAGATSYTISITEREHVIDPNSHACGPGRLERGTGSVTIPATGALTFRIDTAGGDGNICARDILLSEYAMTPQGPQFVMSNQTVASDDTSDVTNLGCQ